MAEKFIMANVGATLRSVATLTAEVSQVLANEGAPALVEFIANSAHTARQSASKVSNPATTESEPAVVVHLASSVRNNPRSVSKVGKFETTQGAPTVVERLINSGRMIRRGVSKFSDLATLSLMEFEDWVDELAAERDIDDEVFEAFYTKGPEEAKRLRQQKRLARKAEEMSKVNR